MVAHVADIFQHPLLTVGELAVLRKITDLDGLPDLNAATVRRQPAGQNIHQRGLAAAVGSHDTDTVVTQQHIAEIFDVGDAVVIKPQMLALDYGLTQTAAGRRHFQLTLSGNTFYFLFQLIKTLDAFLAFSTPRFRAAADPGQLTFINIAQALGRRLL